MQMQKYIKNGRLILMKPLDLMFISVDLFLDQLQVHYFYKLCNVHTVVNFCRQLFLQVLYIQFLPDDGPWQSHHNS